MKNHILIFIFLLSTCNSFFAQIAIEKKFVDGDGLLDFPLGTTKGIILPHVQSTNIMANVAAGTFVFERETSKIKYYNGSTWTVMSSPDGATPPQINSGENNPQQGVIIGSTSSNATGVLVLESSNKALILPKVEDPVNNVKSPYAGMICYDPLTDLLCLFDGTHWTFWGATE